jgi:NitT/TauT family transport system permease protein
VGETTATAAPTEPGRTRGRTRSGGPPRWRLWGLVVLGWLAFLAVWQAGSERVQGAGLPPPREVAVEMWDIVASGRFFEHFQWSLLKTALGCGLALLIGIPVGYLMGRYRYWRAFFLDGVTIAGSIPALTYAALMLVVFGISMQGPILAVALVSLPYVALNVAEGVRETDPDLVRMSRAYRRRPSQIRRHVLVPSVVPYLFTGIRVSFAVAWKVEALTEVFGGSNGVGFEIRREYQEFAVEGVIAWMLLFVVFMVLIERLLLTRAERRVLAWRPRERGRL